MPIEESGKLTGEFYLKENKGMGRRGNFQVIVRKVGDLSVVVSDHETVHIFLKKSDTHIIYHRWFAIKGTYRGWCEFLGYLLSAKRLSVGKISEIANSLDIVQVASQRKLVIDGKTYNYETEATV